MSKVNETLLKSGNCDPSVTTISGVTYYKLVSPYAGDRTKNCGLVGSDIDENFFFLRGNDIKAIYCENGNLVLERVNGEKNIIELDCVSGAKPEFEFDPVTGQITITYSDGEVVTVDGFAINANISLATDNTLRGNGSVGNPLRLSNAEKTGTYSPAEEYLDISEGGELPLGKYNGYRLVTKEKINNFGYLYPLEALDLISRDLENENSEWRIPTKKDWDKLLNAMESCSDYRNHDFLPTSSTERISMDLGEAAGQMLKSYGTYTNEIGDGDGYWKKHNTSHTENSVEGIDLVGMTILPAGRIGPGTTHFDVNDENNTIGKYASFWTNTEFSGGKYWLKTFSYNTSSVGQDAWDDAKLSIRLVKDFNGGNHNETESILGYTYPTVLVRKVYDDFPCNQVWTQINFYNNINSYSGVTCEEWVSEGDVAFFVNEWNGTEWEKKMMREGDSVVILEKDGLEYREWRLKQGELYDVYTEVENIFEDHFENITEIINSLSSVTVNAAITSQDMEVSHSDSGTDLSLIIDSTLKKTLDVGRRKNILGTNIQILQNLNTPYSFNDTYSLVDGEGNVLGQNIVVPNGIVKSVRLGRLDDEFDRNTGLIVEGTGQNQINTIQIVYFNKDSRLIPYKWVNIPLRSLINLGDGIKMEDDTDKLYIKKSPLSENYLSIDENGIAVTGITDAINSAITTFINSQLETAVKNIISNYLVPTKYETLIEPTIDGKLRIGFADDAIFGDNDYADVDWDEQPI